MSGGKKMTIEITSIERLVLQKLLNRKVIHSHHIRLNTLMNCGFKPHEKGEVKRAVYSLIKKDFIHWVKKSKKALSLNKDKITKITSLCVEG
jgi:hypothetical protein